MKRRIILIQISLLSIISSCLHNNITAVEKGESQIRVRLGYKYYSIFIDKEGFGKVVKGDCSLFTDSFISSTSNYSEKFKVDSFKIFLEAVNKLNSKPYFDMSRTDAARLEIFYKQVKIYDAYKWRENVGDIIRPVMEKIPDKFNPFLVSNDLF